MNCLFEGVRVFLTPEDPSGEGVAGPDRRMRVGTCRQLPRRLRPDFIREYDLWGSYFGGGYGRHIRLVHFSMFFRFGSNMLPSVCIKDFLVRKWTPPDPSLDLYAGGAHFAVLQIVDHFRRFEGRRATSR